MSAPTGIMEDVELSGEIRDLVECEDWKDIVFEAYTNQGPIDINTEEAHGDAAQNHSPGNGRHLRVLRGR